jgi:hypothetical protein
MDERTFAIMETMRSAQADKMVRAVKEAVEAKPDISGSEILGPTSRIGPRGSGVRHRGHGGQRARPGYVPQVRTAH